MIGDIDDSITAPNQFLKDSSGNPTIEVYHEFVNWKSCEQALFTLINSTLSPSILILIVGKKFGKSVWKVLKEILFHFKVSHHEPSKWIDCYQESEQ